MAENATERDGTTASSPLRMLATGSVLVGVRSLSTAGRWAGLCLRRSATLADLARETQSGGRRGETAQAVLRDELIRLVREMAEISNQETRLGLEQFDRYTRGPDTVEPSDVDPRRRHRVKS